MKHTKNIWIDHMMTAARITIATLAVGFSMAAFVSSIANAAILKSEVVIKGDNITLGDLFDDLDQNRNAGYVLGPAPRPGKNIVLNSTTLKKLSKAFKLNWAPSAGYEQVVISRAATVVAAEDIYHAVNEAMHREGFAENYKVSVHNILESAILPGYVEPSIRVDNIKIDKSSNQFRATAFIPAYGEPVEEIRIIGAMEYMVDVPVIKRRIDRDEIVKASDIDVISIPEKKVTSDMITRAEDLIGKTPRRVLTPNQITRVSDVTLPHIVKRGEQVTMLLDANGMTLTAKGKAMQDGTKGDIIRVVNMASSRTIEMEVTGEGLVQITR